MGLFIGPIISGAIASQITWRWFVSPIPTSAVGVLISEINFIAVLGLHDIARGMSNFGTSPNFLLI